MDVWYRVPIHMRLSFLDSRPDIPPCTRPHHLVTLSIRSLLSLTYSISTCAMSEPIARWFINEISNCFYRWKEFGIENYVVKSRYNSICVNSSLRVSSEGVAGTYTTQKLWQMQKNWQHHSTAAVCRVCLAVWQFDGSREKRELTFFKKIKRAESEHIGPLNEKIIINEKKNCC